MATPTILVLPLLLVLTAVKRGDSTCPSDILHVDGTCYVYKSSVRKWSKVVNYCKNNFEQTVKPTTQRINNAIKERLKEMNADCKIDNAHRYWIGIHITDTEEFFHFYESSSNISYRDWNPDEPTPAEVFSNDNCVAYECDNNEYWWTTENCNVDLPLICEMSVCPDECIPETTTAPPTTSTQSTAATTGNGTATANATTVTDSNATTNSTGNNSTNSNDNASSGTGGTSNGGQQQTTMKSGSVTSSNGITTPILTIAITLRVLLSKTVG